MLHSKFRACDGADLYNQLSAENSRVAFRELGENQYRLYSQEMVPHLYRALLARWSISGPFHHEGFPDFTLMAGKGTDCLTGGPKTSSTVALPHEA